MLRLLNGWMGYASNAPEFAVGGGVARAVVPVALVIDIAFDDVMADVLAGVVIGVRTISSRADTVCAIDPNECINMRFLVARE